MGVTAADVARRSVSLDALTAAGRRLLWLESGGDGPALVRWTEAGGVQTLGVHAESSLHAYGGGAITVGHDDVWYINAGDGQLWRLGSSRPLTAERSSLGDIEVIDGGLLLVGENTAGDDLLFVDAGSGGTRRIHSAAYLSSPRWHAGLLAWVSWEADTMPWDSSQLWLTEFDIRKGLGRPRCIGGGPGISVVEPRWSPEGALYFMSDETGWWNLYRWTPQTGVEARAPMEADCAAAPWEHGYSSFTFLRDGAIAMIAQRGPRHQLLTIGRESQITQIPLPYTAIKPYLAGLGDSVALIAAAPSLPQQVALVSATQPDAAVVLRSAARIPDPAEVSLPEHLTCDSSGLPISITYYRAAGTNPIGTIIRAHPGPTYQSDFRLDWETQFFTCRGYAVADVDYRGSTGFGRAFRLALNGLWGVADVQDCEAAARYLVSVGKADPHTLIIFGASAGGFTALRAVTNPDTPFALAVARSAIVDSSSWQTTAPRFQRPHATALAARGVGLKAEAVVRPVAIVHGSEDLVAPVTAVRALANALRSRDSDARYLELAGVGHFPSGSALAEALEFELAACQEMVFRSRG